MSDKRKAESKKRKDEPLEPRPKKKKGAESKITENQPTPKEDLDPANDSFNFGGLPERNLKKNLGCG